jgi:6-pyruvoyltetrahydropterin/6-carboxytetrahydropterin synthase
MPGTPAGHDDGVKERMRLYKEFHFEAAHYLPSAPPGHPNARVHGHSFRVRVAVDGEPDAESGIVVHFDDLESALEDAREALDHRLLNEVEGLAAPTLERIAVWLWDRLHNRLPGLAEIEIARDSCHEGCIYRGPQPRLAAE